MGLLIKKTPGFEGMDGDGNPKELSDPVLQGMIARVGRGAHGRQQYLGWDNHGPDDTFLMPIDRGEYWELPDGVEPFLYEDTPGEKGSLLDRLVEVAPQVAASFMLGGGVSGGIGALTGLGPTVSGALSSAAMAPIGGGDPTRAFGSGLVTGALGNTLNLDPVSKGALTGAVGSKLAKGDPLMGMATGAAGGALSGMFGEGETAKAKSEPERYADASKYTGTMTDAPVFDTPAGGDMDEYGGLQNAGAGWWAGAPSTGGLNPNAKYLPEGGMVPTASGVGAFDAGLNLQNGGGLPFDPTLGGALTFSSGADAFNSGIDLANDEYGTPSNMDAVNKVLGLGKPLLAALGMLKGDGSVDLARVLAGSGIVAGLLEGRNSKTATTTTQLPAWYEQGSKEALALAKKYSETPFEPYTGERVADLSENERGAIQMAKDASGRWQPMVDEAGALTREGARDVTNADIRGLVNPALAGLVDDTKRVPALYDEAGNLIRQGALPISRGEIDRYFNPYVEKALDPVARRLNEEAARADNARRARAGMVGAFGGSRDVLDRNLIEQNRLQGVSDLYGTGYARAWDSATGLARGDKDRSITAGGALSSMAGNIGNLSRGAWDDAYTMAKDNRGRKITAGGALTTTARAGMDADDAGVKRLAVTGALDRSVRQGKNDFAFQQYQDRLKRPLTAIDAYSGALRGNPGSTVTRTDPPPSMLGQAAGALGAYTKWFDEPKKP